MTTTIHSTREDAIAALVDLVRRRTDPRRDGGWDGALGRRFPEDERVERAIADARDLLDEVPRAFPIIAAGRALAARAGVRRWFVRARLREIGHSVRAAMAQQRAAERDLYAALQARREDQSEDEWRAGLASASTCLAQLLD